jgi:hypothetical protein
MVSLGPLRHAAFRRLATSYTLNELGWGFGTVALGLVVFDRTHSALAMTGLWICTLLIPALVGPASTVSASGACCRPSTSPRPRSLRRWR